MSLSIITVCHMPSEIIAFSTVKFLSTAGIDNWDVSRWVFVDHHYPIKKQFTSESLHLVANIVQGEIIKPEKNLGGHGGFNYALDYLRRSCSRAQSENDFILLYDPDSNPLNDGWLKAMIEVMEADPTIGYLSLLDERCVNNRKWVIESIAGHRFAYDKSPEMWNVTLFRRWALKDGLKATTELYGGVEAAMFALGFKNGYLYDFRESKCPIPHHESYTQWKIEHAAGNYSGNFDVWISEHSNPVT